MTTPAKSSENKKRPPRFLLAMPDDLRAQIEKAAVDHERPVTAEINMRLRNSFVNNLIVMSAEEHALLSGRPDSAGPRMPQGMSNLSDADAAMLAVFRSLPPEKQLALLSLFR